MTLLRRIFGSGSQVFPRPEQPLWVVGDIHGCHDLMVDLIAQAPRDAQVVCVGDYIDRGDHAAPVLRWLSQRPDIICLMGNHEDMLLDFLRTSDASESRWLRYGGLQTLASFGVGQIDSSQQPDQLRKDLTKAIGEDLVAWLADRPAYYQSGNVAVVHAGADPRTPIDAQDPQTLIWGHDQFARQRRSDGLCVVHGHTIVDEPQLKDGVISIDTGAYATGRLTAVHITTDSYRFHTAPTERHP